MEFDCHGEVRPLFCLPLGSGLLTVVVCSKAFQELAILHTFLISYLCRFSRHLCEDRNFGRRWEGASKKMIRQSFKIIEHFASLNQMMAYNIHHQVATDVLGDLLEVECFGRGQN